MPYLRYNNHSGGAIEEKTIDSIKESMHNKVYSGNAVAVTKTSNGSICEYITCETGDDITDYSFYFGYNNDSPCIYITFSAINRDAMANNEILCLEVENYFTKPYGRWQCIKVFGKNNFGQGLLMNESMGKTWYYMQDIQVGVEYCIYIIAGDWALSNGITRYKHIRLNGYPEDWEMRLNIRPTIRRRDGQFYNNFQKNLKHFIPVKYPLSSEKKI